MELPLDDATDSSDGVLARRVAEGDDRAAEAELMRRLARRVRLFGRRHLRDADEAVELAQDVVLLVLQRLRAGEVRDPERIGSFALGVARLRLREVRQGRPAGEPLDALAARQDDDPPYDLERLAACLQELGDRERTVTTLTWYTGESSDRIADALGTTVGNVRVLRHRALSRLRACMGAEEDAA